jgi:outer membrane murein-binding lipoprotein Lpp
MEAENPQPPKVELSSRTLLIVALIMGVAVTVCSDRDGNKDLKREIRQLRETVERLEKKVDALAPSAAPAPAK